MIRFWLDHIVIAVDDLAQAQAAYAAQGFTVLPGGRHANQATENALICFEDGTYLELLALTGDAPTPGMIDFSRLLAHGTGLVGFALRVNDLPATAAHLRMLGVVLGDVVTGERVRLDGKRVAWQLALFENDFAPFLIADVTPHNLRVPDDVEAVTHANNMRGISALHLGVADLTSAALRYTRLLDVAPDDQGRIALENASLWLTLLNRPTANQRLLSVRYR